MGLLKIVSWNKAGCHNVVRREKNLTYLKQKKADIVLLQETHLNEEESAKLKRDWVAQVYCSTFTSRKQGYNWLNKILISLYTPASLIKKVDGSYSMPPWKVTSNYRKYLCTKLCLSRIFP